MISATRMLCQKYTSLTDDEISYLESYNTLLPAMAKEDLFPTVILDGALPRKTFSMGHAWDKRFYLEARAIR